MNHISSTVPVMIPGTYMWYWYRRPYHHRGSRGTPGLQAPGIREKLGQTDLWRVSSPAYERVGLRRWTTLRVLTSHLTVGTYNVPRTRGRSNNDNYSE